MTFSQSARYHRQLILDGWGDAAQQRLRSAHALVVGCGALGCTQIDLLARAGIGALTLIDRDVVELTNLQRQGLYAEEDVRSGAPKAEAAKRRVAAVNSQVRAHACVEHLDADNVESLARDCTIIVDGLDNYHTRFVLNDLAVKRGIPYVYAGAVGTRGMSMTVAGESSPCLRCVFPEPPDAGGGETCDTVGVFAPTAVAVAAHAAGEAIKFAAGLHDWLDRTLWQIDSRTNREHRTPLADARRTDCPCCGARRFEFLDARAAPSTAILCGRNAVQVRPARAALVELKQLSARLASHGTFELRGSTLAGRVTSMAAPDGGALELTVFADGRAIVRGSTDPTVAQTVYDRLVGS